MTESNRILDYEGSNYRTDFWEGKGRNYEDLVERAIITRLLPKSGKRIIEIGAAYGRLANLYNNFEKVVLLDYSFSQLQYARQQFGDERFMYVAANAYKLPFKQGVFDCATMIRVLHHFESVPNVLKGIRHSIANNGSFLLEFANKRNLKAILRHRMGQQAWNPNDLSPVEFVELNFNFHPDYIQNELKNAQFVNQTRVPVSFFRVGLLKRTVPNEWLAQLDGVLQSTNWMVSPSIFTLNTMQARSDITDNTHLQGEQILACPLTGGDLVREGDYLRTADGLRWAVQDGIYNFKEPVN